MPAGLGNFSVGWRGDRSPLIPCQMPKFSLAASMRLPVWTPDLRDHLAGLALLGPGEKNQARVTFGDMQVDIGLGAIGADYFTPQCADNKRQKHNRVLIALTMQLSSVRLSQCYKPQE